MLVSHFAVDRFADICRYLKSFSETMIMSFSAYIALNEDREHFVECSIRRNGLSLFVMSLCVI